MKKNTTHNLTVAAMLSAVAFILMFIEFPIPMLIPSFVKMDFSDLPALLGAFALGPVYGAVISFMKNLLHIVIKGTSTACVGELCNFMLGAVFSVTAGCIYKHRKSRKTAILGALIGAAAMAVFSAVQLLHHLSGLCAVLSHAAGSHPRHVSGHPALGRQPHQVPRHLQHALHAGQGPVGCGALHGDL